MSHFFEVYKSLEGKKTYILDIEDKEEAKRIIAESIENYKKKFTDTEK